MAHALSIGAVVGGLEVISILGSGAFGITYKAQDRSGRGTFALKEYYPEGLCRRVPDGGVTPLNGREGAYQIGLSAFLGEANVLKGLPKRHGLVRVRGAFERRGTAFCVMEYIEGDSLLPEVEEVKSRGRPMPEQRLRDLAFDMCWALEALHNEGLIHRDIKPANIMMRDSKDPVLIDFGAARNLKLGGPRDSILTKSYAAVEQFPSDINGFDRELPEGPWTDIYALSVVLYELVTGTKPPLSISRTQNLLAGQDDPYVPLMRQNIRLSDDLLEAIDDGMALMPRERIASAHAMAERIAPGRWSDAEHPITFGETTVPRRRRSARKLWAAAMLLLCLMGIAALAFYVYREFYYVEVF